MERAELSIVKGVFRVCGQNWISLRNKAKELALKAIEYDEAENFDEAFKYYLMAAEKLKACIQIDQIRKEEIGRAHV